MKNLMKIVLTTIALLLACIDSNAQITITNGANYYVCQGEQYEFVLPVSSPNYVFYPNFWYFDTVYNTCSLPPCTFDGLTVTSFAVASLTSCNNGSQDYYGIFVTLNSAFPVKIYAATKGCSGGDGTVTFTVTPYVTKIIGSSGICNSTPETYTVVTNGGMNPSNYTWVLPTFLSGSSDSSQIAITGYASILQYGIIRVGVNGCPPGSLSDSAFININDAPQAPTSPPGGILTYVQFGRSCWWDAYVPSVTNATSYQWSFDSTFTPTYTVSTTPTITTGPFILDNHTYTVYVRGINQCGNGPYSEYIKETPPAPDGCIHQPEKNNSATEAVSYSDYKVYPNPANSELTIEYPSAPDKSTLNFIIYTMLGQKVASMALPPTESVVYKNITSLQPGMFIYEIVSENAILNRGKLIIQR